jgi:LPXTG-motif cell wall-anchored protein
MEGANITGAMVPGTVNTDGLFSLTDGETATITGLPRGTYTVEEQQTPEGYTSSFSVNSSADIPAASIQATLSTQIPDAEVIAVNKIKPKSVVPDNPIKPYIPVTPVVPDTPIKPNVPKTPVVPNTPGVPTKTYSPYTGDESPVIPVAITALGMLIGLAILGSYRRKKMS